MSTNDKDEEKILVLKAVRRLIRNEKLCEKLQQQDTKGTNDFLRQFNLPEDAMQHLLDIIERVEYLKKQKSNDNGQNETERQKRNGERKSRLHIERTLMESFDHIRWSFFVSMAMSVILFLVGLFFLTIVVTRSFAESSVSSTTLTIAGLSIADFVLLFYTRPWRDISLNLSNSQKIRTIATSYLASLSLIRNKETEKLKSLEHLTNSSIQLLENIGKESSPNSTSESNS